MKKEGRREQYGSDVTAAGLIPEVTMIGWDRFKDATIASLHPHCHRNTYEICLLIEGVVDWQVRGEEYTLHRGSVFVTHPNEIHGGLHGVMQGCELFWVQIDPEPLPEDLQQGLAHLPKRVFYGSPGLGSFFDTLLNEHRLPSALSPIVAHAALCALLVTLLRDAANAEQDTPQKPFSPLIAKAVARLSADLSLPLSVEQVAHELGISSPRLIEQLLREVGETPGEWRVRRRLFAARAALRASEGVSVTEVAHHFHFTSSQYFATVFKRHFGLTPSQWREETTEGKPAAPDW